MIIYLQLKYLCNFFFRKFSITKHNLLTPYSLDFFINFSVHDKSVFETYSCFSHFFGKSALTKLNDSIKFGVSQLIRTVLNTPLTWIYILSSNLTENLNNVWLIVINLYTMNIWQFIITYVLSVIIIVFWLRVLTSVFDMVTLKKRKHKRSSNFIKTKTLPTGHVNCKRFIPCRLQNSAQFSNIANASSKGAFGAPEHILGYNRYTLWWNT